LPLWVAALGDSTVEDAGEDAMLATLAETVAGLSESAEGGLRRRQGEDRQTGASPVL
jgi:hypothetical protein